MIFAGTPALAQNSAQPSTAEAGTADDIVVTAQRRTENLQDVPIAVTVATSDDLAAAHVDNISNIAAISPSISFSTTNEAAASANIQIRGIGTVGNSRTFEGAVGVFIDGVYRSRSGQALSNFLDIGNVQILRGPQGTLFGKNTSAGALLLTSEKPNISEFAANYELTVGSYNKKLARAAVNANLTDSFALRVAGMVSGQDGFIKDPRDGGSYNDTSGVGFKIQALWEPSSSVRLHLIADYAETDDNCCYGTVDAVDGPTQPLVNFLSASLGNPLVTGQPLRYEQVLNQDTRQVLRDRGVTLTGEFDIGNGTLTSITAYRRWDQQQTALDADFSGADILNLDIGFGSKQFSQELVYNGDLGDVAKYVVGAYYADEKVVATRSLYWGMQGQAFSDALLSSTYTALGLPQGFATANPGRFSSEIMPGRTHSYAAFMHWTVDLTDELSVIAGGRFTREEKKGAFRNTFFTSEPIPTFTFIGVLPGPSYSASKNGSAVSGTLGLRYEFSNNATTYLTYSRGFKAGGVNLDPNAAGLVGNNPAFDGNPFDPNPGAVNVPQDPTFKPETIDGFEAGVKLRWLDGRARTSLAAFYNDITNLQVAQFLGLRFDIVNAAKAMSYGAEIENDFQLTDGLSLQLAATWLPTSEFGSDPTLDTRTSGGADLRSRRFSHAPKFAGNASLGLDQPFNAHLAITGRASVQYVGENFTNTASSLKQKGYALLNFALGLKAINDRWNLTAYCTNCTDKRYIDQHFNTPLQTGDVNAYVGAPRQFGVSLRGKF